MWWMIPDVFSESTGAFAALLGGGGDRGGEVASFLRFLDAFAIAPNLPAETPTDKAF